MSKKPRKTTVDLPPEMRAALERLSRTMHHGSSIGAVIRKACLIFIRDYDNNSCTNRRA